MSLAIVASTTPAERLRKHLTFSQQLALRALLDHMQTDEENVVASKLADAQGITRSVIVAALRLAEVAGLIRAQSMGMKGTRIRILDRAALGEAVNNG